MRSRYSRCNCCIPLVPRSLQMLPQRLQLVLRPKHPTHRFPDTQIWVWLVCLGVCIGFPDCPESVCRSDHVRSLLYEQQEPGLTTELLPWLYAYASMYILAASRLPCTRSASVVAVQRHLKSPSRNVTKLSTAQRLRSDCNSPCNG